MKRILVSNDDGIQAPGIVALAEALSEIAEVTVVAPHAEQSAASHALTIHRPLRVKQLGNRRYAVDGTPTDSVLIAVSEFCERPPDLVVSGINKGPNMGEDVIYSGTVAAAMEGAILDIPSVAISLASRDAEDYGPAAMVARNLAKRLLETQLPRRFLVNVNVPARPLEEIRGTRVARLGTRFYQEVVIRKQDPRGRDYYWIAGEPSFSDTPDTDFQVVAEGYVALTPLLMDLTDFERLALLGELQPELR
jgi:5'-nucleotidase